MKFADLSMNNKTRMAIRALKAESMQDIGVLKSGMDLTSFSIRTVKHIKAAMAVITIRSVLGTASLFALKTEAKAVRKSPIG